MKRELSQTLGKQIQKFRTAKNLTQEDVAEQLDITTKYFASAERGEKQLSLEKLLLLTKLLGVSPNDLFPTVGIDNTSDIEVDRSSYCSQILEITDRFVSANQYVAAIITLKAISDIK